MNRPAFALILVGLSLGAGALGCGAATGGGETIGPKELDRLVIALPEGASIDAVKEKLGEPVSEVQDDEGYDDLHYGEAADFWTIRFKGEKMETRVKALPSGGPTTKGRELNAAIRSLHRGMSTGAVEVKLGEPRDHTLEVGGDEVETLWYRFWGLAFIDGRLDTRTFY